MKISRIIQRLQELGTMEGVGMDAQVAIHYSDTDIREARPELEEVVDATVFDNFCWRVADNDDEDVVKIIVFKDAPL